MAMVAWRSAWRSSFTSAAGTINSGPNVCVRQTSTATPATQTNTTLLVGGVSDTFTSTTAGVIAPPPLPPAHTEIPTMSQWALILLGFGLAGLAALRLRKRV